MTKKPLDKETEYLLRQARINLERYARQESANMRKVGKMTIAEYASTVADFKPQITALDKVIRLLSGEK